MKKIITLLLTLLLLSPCAASAQSSGGLSDLLKGLGKGSSSSSGDGNGSKGSGLGDLLSGVAGALGFGDSGASIEKLSGTWNYKAPAVAFKSDNLLLKAGGAAAAANVEKKLEPYYKTAGIDRLVLTINTDSTFTFKTRMSLNGTITHDKESGLYVFHFKAFKKVNIGSMNAYIQLNGSNAMELTFDVTRLISILQKVSSLSGSASLKGASALLEQYDGLTAGFELKRSATAADKSADATTGATGKR